MKEPKLPRGHAYMRFRNDGYSIHVDFPELKLEWLNKVIRDAMAEYGKSEEEGREKGHPLPDVTKGKP